MRIKCILVAWASSIFLVVSAVPQLAAQATATGAIVGQVTDPSGAAVPGALVSLTDRATGNIRTTPTNSAGRYVFPGVNLGAYDLRVRKTGFDTATLVKQTVNVGATLTENVQLRLGAASQSVEVTPSPVAELQALNATGGASLSGAVALALPNLGRDASSLLLYQANTNPGGQISGAMRDQNTYTLDGGINTSDVDGDGAEYTAPGFSSNQSGSGVVPTPVESIQEIRVTTNNPTADYSHASGGQILMVTKRGTRQWHGSLYDFYQANWLNANTWDNNRLGIARQKQHQNRFGFALGGPLLPKMLGGRTFFYVNYEGRRYPLAQTVTKTVPSALMRQGILQFPDGNGNLQQYNLATSTACGPSGGLACDPRGIGISPVVSALWAKYMPQGNDTSSIAFGRDGINTIADNQQVNTPIAEDSLAFRLDHNFGSRLQWTTNYRYYRKLAPYTGYYDQLDWGGILPGDSLGVPAIASYHPVQPRYFVTTLTAEITPSLTNQFSFNYVRNWWAWTTGGVPQLAPNVPAGISVNGLDPINVDWPSARQRTWNGHDWNYSDGASWIHGNHLVQFGGSFYHQGIHFVHDDASGALTSPIYSLGSSGIQSSALYRPPACTATLVTGCITASNAEWDSLYYATLGVLSSANQVATRSGANLALQPAGTPIAAATSINSFSLYASDSWHLTPRLTFTYGLNWGVQMPPVEQQGHQDILVDAGGTPITAAAYLAKKEQMALAGQNYNPTLGYEPIGATSLGKYPFHPYYGGWSPRLAAAWNPHFGRGFLRTLFGSDSSVLRGGWARINDRTNGSNLVIIPLLGVGFGQAATCYGATSASATGSPSTCAGYGTQTAATAFRLGPDGSTAPLPAVSPTLTTPILPGVNSAAVGNGDTLSPDYRPGVADEFTLTLQRQLPGHVILELGWLGRWQRHQYRTIDLNNVPYMMTLGGQSFAQAYAALARQVLANPAIDPNTVAVQPFFEAALASGPGNYCAGYASCTAAVAAHEGAAGTGNLNNQNVTDLWNNLEGNWVFGPALIQSQGLGGAELAVSNGVSNYNAGTLSLEKRAANGLTLDGNFTWSHALDDGAYIQASTGSQTVNAYNSHYDYGTSLFDLRYVANLVALYNLPYAAGTDSWMRRLLGGWSVAPIFTWHSGHPLIAGGTSFQEFGQPSGNSVNDVGAIPTAPIPAPAVRFGVQTSGNVGSGNNITAQNPNGTQLNVFANPGAVLASLRPPLLGVDSSRSTIIGFGPGAWNLDMNLRKDLQLTESVGATVNLEMINAFNHVNWQDPTLYTQEPALFGTISGPANHPRTMELGLRLHW